MGRGEFRGASMVVASTTLLYVTESPIYYSYYSFYFMWAPNKHGTRRIAMVRDQISVLSMTSDRLDAKTALQFCSPLKKKKKILKSTS